MFENFDDVLSVEEMASAMKIGSTQAYKLVRSGKLKAFKEGKDWKISKAALANYVMERSGLLNHK